HPGDHRAEFLLPTAPQVLEEGTPFIGQPQPQLAAAARTGRAIDETGCLQAAAEPTGGGSGRSQAFGDVAQIDALLVLQNEQELQLGRGHRGGGDLASAVPEHFDDLGDRRGGPSCLLRPLLRLRSHFPLSPITAVRRPAPRPVAGSSRTLTERLSAWSGERSLSGSGPGHDRGAVTSTAPLCRLRPIRSR